MTIRVTARGGFVQHCYKSIGKYIAIIILHGLWLYPYILE
jgi:hypothetical protein